MYLLAQTQILSYAITQLNTNTPRSSYETPYGVESNNDIYGIAIRIGIYAQIIAV